MKTMKVGYEITACYIAMALLLTTGTSAAEENYIISKKDDAKFAPFLNQRDWHAHIFPVTALLTSVVIGQKTLLSLSIIFLVVCAVFLLVSVAAAITLLRRSRSRGRESSEYYLEEREERYQSMYAGKSNGLYDTPPSHYESLKIGESSNGVYQSPNSNNSNGQLNGESKTKQVTPPGTEKGQIDSKESEKRLTLGSFQNPAYESSTPYGLDKVVEFAPNSEDHDDTAL